MVQKKKKNTSSKYMTYCLSCKKYTNDIASKNITRTNKVLRQKSGCSQCLSDKSRFLKQKHDERSS